MSDGLLFLALSLAVFRLWRFIGKDDLTEPVRRIFTRTDNGFFHQLVTCPWCAGSWLSLAGVYATHRYLVALAPHWLLWAVAVAGAVGLLGELDERLSSGGWKLP